jgi:uncharacterized protein YjbJ (UPF0337 family)
MHTHDDTLSWNEQKGRLRQKFVVLTDNDLMFENSKNEEMLSKLENKLGITKDDLRRIFASL